MSNQSSTSSSQLEGNGEHDEMLNEDSLVLRNLQKIDALLEQQRQIMKTIEGIKLIIQKFHREIGHLVAETLEHQMARPPLSLPKKSTKGRIRKQPKPSRSQTQKKMLPPSTRAKKEQAYEQEKNESTKK